MSEISFQIPLSNYSRSVRSLGLVSIFFFTGVFFFPKAFVISPVSAQETTQTGNDKTDEQTVLREIRIAKNFIENEQWEKARVKLAEIIANNPRNRYLDIAYFWLAYTLFQQQKYTESEQIINDLQRDFPNSDWIDESKSLLAEINSKNGRKTNLTSGEFSNADDETKAFAVQNLLKTDHPQATVMIDEILAPASKASNDLKESVLILLFDDKSDWATDKFVQALKNEKSENVLKQSLIGLGSRDEKKILPVLRNFLEQNDNENLTDAALYALSEMKGEAPFESLNYFAQSGKTDELKQKSIIWIGNAKSPRRLATLQKLYGLYTATDLKEQVQISLSEIDTPESLEILMGLIDGETNEELIDHGLELLKEKNEPPVVRYLEKKLRTRKQ